MDTNTVDTQYNESCELSGERGTRFRATVLMTVLYSVAAGILLGFAITYVGWLQLRLVLCSTIGMLLAIVLSKTGQAMHCRNAFAMKVLGVVGALFCIQSAFSVYVWIGVGTTATGAPLKLFDVLFTPYVVWQVLDSIAQSGQVTSNGRSIGALQVWLYWIIEVGAMTVTLFILLTRNYAKLSYCEPCKVWLSQKREQIFLEPPTDKSVEQAVECGDLTALLNLKILKEPEFPYLRLNYTVCPSCNGRGVYQISMLRNDSSAIHEFALTPTLSMRNSEKHALAKLIVAKQELLNVAGVAKE